MSFCQQATNAVLSATRSGKRKLVALAGPPASGKSTLAAELAKALCDQGSLAQVVPMDGFHLDNQILTKRGLLSRKGAPETFDSAGLLALVPRLKNENEVFFPVFDRKQDTAIAGAGHLSPECDTVIVEGNYLLLTAPDWNSLHRHWDVSVMLSVPTPTLESRLISRWTGLGLSEQNAKERATKNDLLNAQLVSQGSAPATVTLSC